MMKSPRLPTKSPVLYLLTNGPGVCEVHVMDQAPISALDVLTPVTCITTLQNAVVLPISRTRRGLGQHQHFSLA